MKMQFDAEKEVAKLWRNLHTAQGEVGKTYYLLVDGPAGAYDIAVTCD